MDNVRNDAIKDKDFELWAMFSKLNFPRPEYLILSKFNAVGT